MSMSGFFRLFESNKRGCLPPKNRTILTRFIKKGNEISRQPSFLTPRFSSTFCVQFLSFFHLFNLSMLEWKKIRSLIDERICVASGVIFWPVSSLPLYSPDVVDQLIKHDASNLNLRRFLELFSSVSFLLLPFSKPHGNGAFIDSTVFITMTQKVKMLLMLHRMLFCHNINT